MKRALIATAGLVLLAGCGSSTPNHAVTTADKAAISELRRAVESALASSDASMGCVWAADTGAYVPGGDAEGDTALNEKCTLPDGDFVRAELFTSNRAAVHFAANLVKTAVCMSDFQTPSMSVPDTSLVVDRWQITASNGTGGGLVALESISTSLGGTIYDAVNPPPGYVQPTSASDCPGA